MSELGVGGHAEPGSAAAPAMVSAGRRWRSFAKIDDTLPRPERESKQDIGR